MEGTFFSWYTGFAREWRVGHRGFEEREDVQFVHQQHHLRHLRTETRIIYSLYYSSRCITHSLYYMHIDNVSYTAFTFIICTIHSLHIHCVTYSAHKWNVRSAPGTLALHGHGECCRRARGCAVCPPAAPPANPATYLIHSMSMKVLPLHTVEYEDSI